MRDFFSCSSSFTPKTRKEKKEDPHPTLSRKRERA
jgi:hypothetical protein